MIKAKWGTKRTCPKCGTRFYDLGKEDPVVCIECGNEWIPEPILKSRQPQLEEAKDLEAEAETKDKDDDEDLAIDDEDGETNPDDDIDIGEGEDVPDVISKTKAGSDE